MLPRKILLRHLQNCFYVILNGVNDLNLLKIRDFRSAQNDNGDQ